MLLFSPMFYWKIDVFFAMLLRCSSLIQGVSNKMTEEDEIQLEKKLDILRYEHRVLDQNLSSLNASDAFMMAMLKKKKLFLRDQIAMIEQQLYPDITA